MESNRAESEQKIDDVCSLLWDLRAKILSPVWAGDCSASDSTEMVEKAKRINAVRDELSLIKRWL